VQRRILREDVRRDLQALHEEVLLNAADPPMSIVRAPTSYGAPRAFFVRRAFVRARFESPVADARTRLAWRR
jgi:hypothetical protein